MNILIIGSGGREHALAWKIKQSPLVKKIFCAPGNGGIAEIAECIDVDIHDHKALLKVAKDKAIDLTIVGPEGPLVDGLVNAFEKKDFKIFGPSAMAAQLEGSKIFAKEFMRECNIPTAVFKTFDKIEKAQEFLAKAQFPLVVKADGLAAGKGVFVCQSLKEALDALEQIMTNKVFGESGNQVLIEEALVGDEVSVLVLSDGENYVILDAAQDHKRIFDDDLGPNTGGMGAYSPTPIMNEELLKKIEARIIDPVIRGMRRNGAPFRGVLYAGLMITIQGPMVLEFNVRFGDPETRVILPRLKNDLVEIFLACCEERLDKIHLKWDKRHSVCVVMTSGGYPGKYETGFEIKGLEQIKESDTFVFHAGTTKQKDKIVTSGGRVLGVSALGQTIEQAIEKAYKAVEKIKFERSFFRRDIGNKAVSDQMLSQMSPGARRR